MSRKVSPRKECKLCRRNLVYGNYYLCNNSPFFPDNRFDICKRCVGDLMEREDAFDIFLAILHSMNRPFIIELWERVEHDYSKYFGQSNSLPQYSQLTWNDGDLSYSGIASEHSDTEVKNSKTKDRNYEEMVKKWGSGYTPDEYISFENKYRVLINNYPIRTSMHEEALLTYIRFRVREEMATAEGNSGEAKKWGELASKAAQDAKINPSQLSQADLSQGLDTIGQIVRAAEQHEDIIEILPKFKETPKDKVDFTILSYINYARHLEGKELVKQKDVYNFLEERKKEYAPHLSDETEGEE